MTGQLAGLGPRVIPTGVTRGRPNPLHHDFPLRLRRSRKAVGLSPAKLVRDAGLSKNAVSRLEEGTTSPRLPTVEKLARVLGVAPGWLAYDLGEQVAQGEGPLRCAELAERVREVRDALGLSAREVDRRAGIAESGTRYLQQGGMPTIATLEYIARALGVSPAWLAFGIGPMELPRRRATSSGVDRSGTPQAP